MQVMNEHEESEVKCYIFLCCQEKVDIRKETSTVGVIRRFDPRCTMYSENVKTKKVVSLKNGLLLLYVYGGGQSRDSSLV